jgi:hypothetical protein
MPDKIIPRGIKLLADNGVVIDRDWWLKVRGGSNTQPLPCMCACMYACASACLLAALPACLPAGRCCSPPADLYHRPGRPCLLAPPRPQEAEASEKSHPPMLATCRAIVKEVVGHGVEEEDRKRTWMADAGKGQGRAGGGKSSGSFCGGKRGQPPATCHKACTVFYTYPLPLPPLCLPHTPTPLPLPAEECLRRGSVETARTIYDHACSVFPGKKSIWRRAAQLEKAHGTGESLDAMLRKAVKFCPQAEVLWLMAAKEKWLSGGQRMGLRGWGLVWATQQCVWGTCSAPPSTSRWLAPAPPAHMPTCSHAHVGLTPSVFFLSSCLSFFLPAWLQVTWRAPAPSLRRHSSATQTRRRSGWQPSRLSLKTRSLTGPGGCLVWLFAVCWRGCLVVWLSSGVVVWSCGGC